MFIEDIQTVGVPDLDHLSEVNITNHFFKYQQKQIKVILSQFNAKNKNRLDWPEEDKM